MLTKEELAEQILEAVRGTPEKVTSLYQAAGDAFLDSCEERGVNPMVAGLAAAYYLEVVSRDMADQMKKMAAELAADLANGLTPEEIRDKLDKQNAEEAK